MAIPAERTRPAVLTGFGRTAGTLAHVGDPADAAEVAELVLGAGPRGALARGLGRCYGDAAQNAGGLVLGTAALDRVDVDPVVGVAIVGAGVVLDDLIRQVLPLGWFVPVTPGTSRVTVGGAIAADVHGKNHHADGSFGDHLVWIDLVDGRGALHRLEPGDPRFEATCGGLGLTGVIVGAGLRLLPVASSSIRVASRRVGDLDAMMAGLAEGDAAHRYSVAWIDLVGGGAVGRGVLEHGDHADAGDVAGDPLAIPDARALPAPPWVPTGLLNRATARLFNEAWYRRAADHDERVVPYASFFHPLDRVDGWNRLYGEGGFVQHQFVVPVGAEDAVAAAVERIRADRAPVMLAVLKRMGPGRGLLAFPQEGWTLAIDLPARWPGLRGLCDALDAITAAAGGRVYLVKDARLAPAAVPVMYPELDAWRAIRDGLDPERRLRSDLDRRLGLAVEHA